MTTATGPESGEPRGDGVAVCLREDVVRSQALATLDETRQALAMVESVADAKQIHDRAKAMQSYAREARDTAMFEKATRLFMEAERRAGELLGNMTKAKGGQPYRRSTPLRDKGVDPTLADFGISYWQSWKWRMLAEMPAAEFDAHVEKTSRRVVSAASRAEDTAARRAERMAIIAELSRGNAPLGQISERYPIIYADPPWQYDYTKDESRAVENQYPTMTLEEIKALPVADIAYEQCVLFLWATPPKVDEAMQVIDAWGFTYRTVAVWDKQKIGMGYYFRQQHELLLIATRGNPPAPAPENRPASVYSEPRGTHSSKPVYYYGMIEAMYPGLPKIELFARCRRDGWDAWGNEAGDTP